MSAGPIVDHVPFALSLISTKLLHESKEDMRCRGVPTPDEGHAVALCFTEPGGLPVPRSIALNFNRRIEYPKYSIA
jgi:hypothetical protein